MNKLVKWEAKAQNLHRLFRENLYKYAPFPEELPPSTTNKQKLLKKKNIQRKYNITGHVKNLLQYI